MENHNIRNFVIIAHIDHGKSTLADRFLELTGTIPKEKMRPQYLDMMDLEREKGITIKMAPVRMCWKVEMLECWDEKNNTFSTSEQSERSNKRSDQTFVLNLIDTPGHADFSYEVSRALAAVEGAILLVDATKGVQAQTVANLELARKQNLVIIPAINKIDLPQAKIEETKEEISHLLGIPKEEIFLISAKTGENVKELLEGVIKKIPPPQNLVRKGPFRALVFDSKYDPFKGVIAYVRVFEGEIKPEEKISFLATKAQGVVKELGFFTPFLTPQKELKAGEIGYIATGIKEPILVRVGDTIVKISNSKFLISKPEPLPGYQEPKPVVFASIFPQDSEDYDLLKNALSKLKLNDASLTFEPQTQEFLGRGFLCGFLGTLHAEIICERLAREFSLKLVISRPGVLYKILKKEGKEVLVKSVSEWPRSPEIVKVKEPWVRLEIITSLNYLGNCLEVLETLREKKYIETKYLSKERVVIISETSLREIMEGFYEKLKNQTQGFASLNYEIIDWREGDVVKLEVLIAGKKEEAFSKIVYRKLAYQEGKKIVEKLKEILPAQLFEVPLQAVIENRVIARETIKAKRRDVISPLYGGDYTRKRKLLEKQKKGKKELKEKGKVNIPPKVFLEIFRT